MIQSLRQIRTRIRAIENTKKITRAMEMVSASKLNRIKTSFNLLHPYFLNLEYILKNLLADIEGAAHPLLERRDEIKSIGICVIASDTGLCGTYNHNIMTAAEMFMERRGASEVKLVAVGKEAFAHFKRRGYKISGSHLGRYGRYSSKFSEELAGELTNIFLTGQADEIYVAYTRFSPRLRHAPVVLKFLGLECEAADEKRYILEPDKDRILDKLIPKYLSCRMNDILLDTFTSENSSRMLAMKTATDNAEELISMLTLMRNKARQAAITKEVLEVALSAEALKG